MTRLTVGDITTGGKLGPVVPAAVPTGTSGMPDPDDIEADVILQAFRLLGRDLGNGRMTTMGWGYDVECPWSEEHSSRIVSGTTYAPVVGRFRCHHGHCQDRTTTEARVKLDQLLRLPPPDGPGTTLAALEFGVVDPQGIPLPAGWRPAPGRPLRSYEATEDGLALAFADERQGKLRFDHLKQRWFVWNGGFWREDDTARAFAWARELARLFRKTQDSDLKQLAKIAVAGAIERAARADARLAVDGRGWDQDKWRVGAPGCEIDLVSGTSQPPDPAHGITRQLLVAPGDIPTPLWDQFLWDSTGGDPEMIEFLQAWAGYCLTGDTSEEKFVFIYGPGGNGKGTYLHTFNAILGDYAARTPAETFMVRKHEAHPEEIARLMGARAVTATEIEEGRTFNVARLKDLTGRDGKIAGAFKHQHWFEFTPQFKVTFVGNHQPKLVDVDEAMRRRMIIVPFTQTPTKVDTTLKDRLVAEYPGILRWAIQGENRRRQMGGLAPLVPASAVAATRRYLDDQDWFKTWGEDHCMFGPGLKMRVLEGFEAYRSWCHANGGAPTVGERQFSRKFLDVFPSCHHTRDSKGQLLVGAKLLPQNVGVC
jgi:putative DNA primase/helicase